MGIYFLINLSLKNPLTPRHTPVKIMISSIKNIISSILIGASSVSFAMAAPSILDIKHSITDDNVIPPESFETMTRELQENFYLKTYTMRAAESSFKGSRKGTAKEYEDLLSRLPVEIEMPYNQIVGKFIDMYLDRRRSQVADMLALHNYYGKIFVEELIKEGLPLELQYLPVIESALNPNAISRAGAGGLWQFMPATATGLGMEVNSLVDERRDPRLSSRNAARYLKQLYNIYGDWSLAIAAYNCGPGNVNKALRRAGGGKLDFWEIYEYLPKETRGYVPIFIAANFVMNYHNRYGINPTVVKQQLVTDTVKVNDRVHFRQISEVLHIPVEEIRMLNPQFRKDIIPGDHHPYTLVLPSQQTLSYIVSRDAILNFDADEYTRRTYVEPGQSRPATGGENIAAAGEQSANALANNEIFALAVDSIETLTHKVGRGESLRDIARRYGVSSTDIKRWNHLRRGKVKEGDSLTIQRLRRDVSGTSVAATGKSTVTELRKSTASSTTKSDSSAKSRKKKDVKSQKPKSYTVKSGDSLDKIARRNGVTVDALRKANGMSKKASNIQPGQKLKIPAKGKSSVKSGKSSTKKKSGTSKKRSSKRRRR